MLGISHSGVDYTQGLTVIINDHQGRLPLTPTKDGIAWSERAHGEIFERNIWAWTGAVAQCFWKEHNSRFGSSALSGNRGKEIMKKTIHSYVQDQLNIDPSVQVPQNLEKADLKTYVDFSWQLHRKAHGTHWTIRRKGTPTTTSGTDTLFPITHTRIQQVKSGGNPRKPRVPIVRQALPVPVGRTQEGKRKYAEIHHNGNDDVLKDEDEGPIPTLPRPTRGNGNVEDVEADDTWPEIDPKYIPRVAHTMLKYLRGMKHSDLFENPVIETYPWLKDQYLEKVAQPMDFATIEEKRLPQYTSVTQLQQDLILTFQNSVRFNGKDSQYAEIANDMLETLDEAYKNSLLGKRLRKRPKPFNGEQAQVANPRRQSNSSSTSRHTSGRSGGSLQAQLKTEREKVVRLEKLLAKKDARIRELEMMLPEGIGTANSAPYVPVALAPAQAAGAPLARTPYVEEGCEICKKNDNHHLIILCDSCDREYHTYCLNPPLSSIPEGEWYCPHCNEKIRIV